VSAVAGTGSLDRSRSVCAERIVSAMDLAPTSEYA